MAAPEPRTDDPAGVSPAALARFDTLCSRMGLIAEAVNTFQDAALRERAFFELVSIINPDGDEDAPDYHTEGVYCGEPAHCTPPYAGAPPGTPYPARSSIAELRRIADWIRAWAPAPWRSSVGADKSTSDAAIAMLDAGAIAWEQVRRALLALEATGFFTAEQINHDIAARITELGTALQLRRDSGQVDDRKQAN